MTGIRGVTNGRIKDWISDNGSGNWMVSESWLLGSFVSGLNFEALKSKTWKSDVYVEFVHCESNSLMSDFSPSAYLCFEAVFYLLFVYLF